MPVARMLRELDSAELSGWMAYDRIEAIPDPNWLAAMVASTFALVHGARVRLEDFLPRRVVRKPKSVAENLANAKAFFACYQSKG